MIKLLCSGIVCLGALAPVAAQALTISILSNEQRDGHEVWTSNILAGLEIALDSNSDFQVLESFSYNGVENFQAALDRTSADVIVSDFADAESFAVGGEQPLFINLAAEQSDTCTANTLHLAGDVELGRLAAVYLNGLNTQRTFTFLQDSDEGRALLDGFRSGYSGGLGGAAFAVEGQVDFSNEVGILRVTKADGAYFDLEGELLYTYLNSMAESEVLNQVSAVTTSLIDYDLVSSETRAALDTVTLVSAWNADTVDAATFKSNFRSLTGNDPSFEGLLGFEVGGVLIEAARDGRDDLFANALSLSWQSPRGPVQIDEFGYAIVPVSAFRLAENALSLKARIAVPANNSCAS